MITRAMEAEVLRLHHAEKWPIGTIARQLMLHHSTVRRVLAQAGVPEAQKTTRPAMADPFIPFMLETLKAYPKLCASRQYIMVRERGYRGGSDHFRSIVARLRPRPIAEAYLRLRTLPGQQAQCDWAHFGSITIGKATRPPMRGTLRNPTPRFDSTPPGKPPRSRPFLPVSQIRVPSPICRASGPPVTQIRPLHATSSPLLGAIHYYELWERVADFGGESDSNLTFC
jgi:hypothetical protein